MKKIKSFKDNDTEKIYQQKIIKGVSKSVQEIGLRKLMMMDASETIQDLRVPPGNRLEKLIGNREGYYSIRINDRYRIVFKYEDGYFCEVSIEDYH